ncbi:MAG: hypothetical protein ACJA00_004891 [Myxococcota bacterium]|jgi:hypothetical protein
MRLIIVAVLVGIAIVVGVALVGGITGAALLRQPEADNPKAGLTGSDGLGVTLSGNQSGEPIIIQRPITIQGSVPVCVVVPALTDKVLPEPFDITRHGWRETPNTTNGVTRFTRKEDRYGLHVVDVSLTHNDTASLPWALVGPDGREYDAPLQYSIGVSDGMDGRNRR